MSKRTEKSFFGRVLIPIEAMAGGEYVVVELNHREHRGMKKIYVLLNGRRCQFEDSESEKPRPNIDKGHVDTKTFTFAAQ